MVDKMNNNRLLYISCLCTPKEQFDGERIKCTLIYESLKKFIKLDVINLSTHKIINSLKIFFKSLFGKKKYDYVIISKDSHGANIIQKLLKLSHYPSSKIVYFEIGPFLYDRVLDGLINKNTFLGDRLIVVETQSMKDELLSVGFERVAVFPNFKPVCEIPFSKVNYPKPTLEAVYLSRIEEPKGIYDLIGCLVNINNDSIKFKLDVYGRPQSKDDELKMQSLAEQYSFINYLGPIEVGSKESYVKLSKYDLHVFPTKYREGFPGRLIDFFIAGVPTLSSSFARAHEILSDSDSIIYKQDDNEELTAKLAYIYENQNLLSHLRENTFSKRKQYSVESFEDFLKGLIKNDFKEL